MRLKREATRATVCLLAAASLLAVAVAGCGGGDSDDNAASAEDQSAVRVAAEHFMEAWGSGDGKAACALMTDKLRQTEASLVAPGTCEARVAQFNRLHDRIGEPRANTLRIVRLMVTPPVGTVTLQAKNEQPVRSIFLTKSDDGKWLVDSFTF